jgi:hypothetical protein
LAIEGWAVGWTLEIVYEHAFRICLTHFPVYREGEFSHLPGPTRNELDPSLRRRLAGLSGTVHVTTRLPKGVVKAIKIWSIDAGQPPSGFAVFALRYYLARRYAPPPSSQISRDEYGRLNLPIPTVMQIGDGRGGFREAVTRPRR